MVGGGKSGDSRLAGIGERCPAGRLQHRLGSAKQRADSFQRGFRPEHGNDIELASFPARGQTFIEIPRLPVGNLDIDVEAAEMAVGLLVRVAVPFRRRNYEALSVLAGFCRATG